MAKCKLTDSLIFFYFISSTHYNIVTVLLSNYLV